MRAVFLLIQVAVPSALIVFAAFSPLWGASTYLAYYVLTSGYLWIIDRMHPSVDRGLWTDAEAEVIQRYHVALRYPLAAKTMSVHLNGLRFLGLLVLAPWLLWNQMWAFAIALAVLFLLTGPLVIRLDPFHFLAFAARKGNKAFATELAILGIVAHRVFGVGKPAQPSASRESTEQNGGDAATQAMAILQDFELKYRGELGGPLAIELVILPIRRHITENLSDFRAMVGRGTSPAAWVLGAIANTSGDHVESGRHHVYRGVLDPMGPGPVLVRIFDEALSQLVDLGAIDADAADQNRSALRENIKREG